jgi:hypothetical protein
MDRRPAVGVTAARVFVAPLLVAVALLGWTTAPRAAGSADASDVGAAERSATKSAAVRAATAEVLRETSEVRKLPVLRAVRSGAQSRAEIEQMLVKNLERGATEAEALADELTLKRLGMPPANFHLRSFLVRLLAEQVAGYYDPRTRQFYLADWLDLDVQKPVIAHELTHALQDQHFDLRRFERWPKHESDAELAAHALVEGDATLTMFQYVRRDLRRQLAMFRSLLGGGSGSTEVYDSAPRVVRESLIFPYSQGSTWVDVVYERGGWELVSAAYKRLPASTEQILHPEKYFAGEAPVRVNLRDISRQLGRNWRMADHDVNGEWGFYLLLDEFLKSNEVSRRAAGGWGGDRYALFLGPKETDALVTLKTIWDTERDAEEFFDAYARRTTARYGATPRDSTRVGELFWETSDGGVFIQRKGRINVILEGLPAGSDARSLAGLL